MVSFSIPINFELYMDYVSYQRGQIATNIKVQYGLLNNFQITGLIPLIVKWDERKDQDEPYTGAGLSNLELEGLYSLDVRNLIKKIDTYDLFFSAGINYSIATDDGWRNYEFDSSGAPIIKLPISNGFNTLIFIASLGIQRQSMFAFLEYKYNIKGKRSDSKQGWSYNPTNNAELNLIGSFFINNRTKLRSEITVDDLQNKSGLILLKPSIHKLLTESFVWSFGFFFPIKNDYDYNYFGLNMGFTWIN